LSRNPRFAHRLVDRGAELAVHAYTHVDLTSLTQEQQTEHLGKAIQLFRKHGVPFTGFRAPYLHWNEETMRAVEDYQFRYSSNEIVLWDALNLDQLTAEQLEGWEKGRAFYKPHDAAEYSSLPFRRRGFIEIPVSLPDDEILLDRMYISDISILEGVWEAILETTYERGELFTVQLHPERIDFFSNSLGNLLGACRDKTPGVWIATLDEIAQWWMDKAQNSAKFVREKGNYVATVKACRGSSLYLREKGRERSMEPGEFRIETEQRPCVGVDPGSERRAIQALCDRGYILEAGEESEGFAVHLGRLESAEYTDILPLVAKLEAFEGPLLRFGTWPHGNRSALAVTGDIDALTIWDFVSRFRGA
jgi:peptidoglycan/xylan/chitin deacetylase (PgdA/CDA1 family)